MDTSHAAFILICFADFTLDSDTQAVSYWDDDILPQLWILIKYLIQTFSF